MTNMTLQMIGIDEWYFKNATEVQRVSWAKANTTIMIGLCESARKYMYDLRPNMCGINGFGKPNNKGENDLLYSDTVYVLSPDYQPPVKRWWFNTVSLKTWCCSNMMNRTNWLEVTADYAAYLSEKPEGEWELRKPGIGDVFVGYSGIKEHHELIWDAVNERGSSDKDCYRWCKPKAVAGWVEYPVEVIQDSYHVIYPKRSESLSKAANRVGFGGVQFETRGAWYMETRKLIDTHGMLFDIAITSDDRTPAVPVRCRFCEGPQ